MSTRPVYVPDLLERPRQAPRRAMRIPAHVRPRGELGAPWPLDLAELSETGAFVASDLLLPVGLALDLAFSVPGRATPILARGRVVRVDEDAGAPGMGVVFDAVSPTAREALRAFASA